MMNQSTALIFAVLSTLALINGNPHPNPEPAPASGTGGSVCEGTSCTPAPPGVSCDPKYERDDKCCPVWYCSNGQTIYGKTSSSSSFTSSSMSSSIGNPPKFGFPSFGGFGGGFPKLPGFGGGGGFPFFGRR